MKFLTVILGVAFAATVVVADMAKIKKCASCMSDCVQSCREDRETCRFPPLDLDAERIVALVSGNLVKSNYTVTHFAHFKEPAMDKSAGVSPMSTYIDFGVPGLTKRLFPGIFTFLATGDPDDDDDDELTTGTLRHLVQSCRENCGNRTWNYGGWGFEEDWGGVCESGDRQSPIDLPPLGGSHVASDLSFEDCITYVDKYTIANTGDSITIFFTDETVTTTWMLLDGIKYRPRYMSLRWPSEHTIDGKRAAMEMQVTDISDGGDVAVTSWLFDVDYTGNLTSEFNMNTVAAAVFDANLMTPGFDGNETKIRYPIAFYLTTFDSIYYRYNGSLSHPPCTQPVTWLVRKEIDTVSLLAWRFFQNVRRCDLIGFNETGIVNDVNSTGTYATIDKDMFGNIRNIQDRNGRAVDTIQHLSTG